MSAEYDLQAAVNHDTLSPLAGSTQSAVRFLVQLLVLLEKS